MGPQSFIGHYRIISKLGEGGMGAVYRATDTRLNRDVAIKVIPDAFADNPGRMARFEREAQVLASLNHPNIGAIYGVEERALVMELVEGITLQQRIASGPLPLDEGLAIAQQMADGLAYAHDRGVVHRDLKPANIMLTADDRVKVLDFGLAKALSGDPSSPSNPTVSPTLTMNATVAGVIMGTAAYMAPEQARGKAVDKRGDIWAFGVVLMEMLTGARLFAGETVSDTLAAVLRGEIDYSRLPPGTPAGVRRVIQRCLERDPARRLRDIGDARILMEPVEVNSPAIIPAQRRKPWLALAGVLAGMLVASAATWYLVPRHSPAPLFFELQGPKGAQPISPAVSPDGRAIAFIRIDPTRGPALYVRRLDALEVKPVPGSENATSRPFWSPDSRRIGFFAEGKLKVVSPEGGDIRVLANGLLGGRPSLSGAWNSAGDIVFNQLGNPVSRIAETGGAITPVLLFDASRQETGQLVADFLADGKHFLYTSSGHGEVDIYEGSLDGSKPVLVLPSAAVLGYARPAQGGPGYMFFYKEGQILLRPFDEVRHHVYGNTFGVATEVSSSSLPTSGTFLATTTLGSISNSTLAFAKSFGLSRQLAWVARDGKPAESTGEAGNLADVQISPDQHRLAFTRADHGSDIWLADLDRGSTTRVTFSEGSAGSPIFSPDSARIAYSVEGPDGYKAVVRSSSLTGGTETIFAAKSRMELSGWSRDGEWLAAIIGDPGRWDIQLLPVKRERKPVPLVVTPFDEYQPQFSPDGRWIAYTSNESGRYETYVVNAPDTVGGRARVQGKWQISTAGGQQPRWRADTKELFYLSLEGQMMAANIESGEDAFRASVPASLFTTALVPIGPPCLYDVTADGRRFVLLSPAAGATPTLSVVVNWAGALVKRDR